MTDLATYRRRIPDKPSRKDPPIRPDKLCAQCGGERGTRLPKVATKRNRAELIKHLAGDAFCSAQCARLWHGVDVAEQPAKVNKIAERAWAHEPGWAPA